MKKHKFLNLVMSLLIIASFVWSGSKQAAAMPMSPTDESAVPHYFGPYPNWANSPFTMPDVGVVIDGDGMGAAAEATVGANGAITSLTLTSAGSGYTFANVSFTGAGTGAAASATVALSGVVTNITVTNQGGSYTSPMVALNGGGGTGTLVQFGNALQDRAYATDFPPEPAPRPILVVLNSPLSAGTLTDFLSWNQAAAGASPTPSAGETFIAYVLRPGLPGEYTVVFESPLQTVPPLVDPLVSELAMYPVGNVPVLAGDVIAFFGAGIPVDTTAGADFVSYPAAFAPVQGGSVTLGGVDYPLIGGTRTYSFAANVIDTSAVVPLTAATATAYGGVDSVQLVPDGNGVVGGVGYIMPTVDFDMPDAADGVQASGHAIMDANGTITEVIIDNSGSGYSAAPNVVIRDGTIFDPITHENPFTAALAATTINIQGISLDSFGDGYSSAPDVVIWDSSGSGVGASAVAEVNAGSVTSIVLDLAGSGYVTPGGIKKFTDGLPGLCDPAGVLAPVCPNYLTDPTAKYIPLGVADMSAPYQNPATADVSQTYEIAVVQYRMKFHSDLPPTLVRGYVQLETAANFDVSQHFPLVNEMLDGTQVPIMKSDGVTPWLGVTPPQYLGPTIVTPKDQAVRIVFRNLLPTGDDGDLFLPVDSTMMGSGMGPVDTMEPYDPLPTVGGDVMDMVRNPMCTDERSMGDMCFLKNRATLHLHGGNTPWISDGTPHQWVTPAGDMTMWPEGVSVENVPDMDVCGPQDDGCQTFYYTNQQSARLLFYHDHAWGITRLNVYAGEAAGYLITDATEQALIAAGAPLDGLSYGIPLVIQDKTFVPQAEQLAWQDPTWNSARWGSYGNLWYHHVYMPAQNPGDPGGMSGFGRWMYGPWFWPPAGDAKYGPIPNPYYTGTCLFDDPTTWDHPSDPFCEPELIPGTPNISAGMEQFNDTPLVNGTAYPTVTLEPKSYRFRVLSAANDRFFNLQWYVGDPSTASTGLNSLGEVIGATEVALDEAKLADAQVDPVVFPTPDTLGGVGDPSFSAPGPEWIQIGTEGGFLPTPVMVDGQQVTTWITDPTRFDVGNVDQHSLLLAPAERADVIVDFSQFAGKTLILYNDAPAAFPARIPSYDYYTGAPDLSPVGAPTILPGYGPNTRTIMQVKIANVTPDVQFDRPGTTSDRWGRLLAAFRHHADGSGVFESGQHPIIVGQAPYNTAYGTSFVTGGWCNSPTNPSANCDGYARISEQGGYLFKFDTLRGTKVEVKIEPKSIHDETNATSFDEFGRMQANLGLEQVPATPGLANFIPHPYTFPTTEIIDTTGLPTADVEVTPISSGSDGTQIWKITHNGVDTHPIHFHAFDVQILNRVTWDNIIIPPDPTELGWKDTIRVAPLEDTIIALRAVTPALPFELPNSIRLLSPMMPDGMILNSSTIALQLGLGLNAFAPNGEPIDVINHYINFGAEYVYHCHILSHEEMDMMRPVSLAFRPKTPDGLGWLILPDGTMQLTWNDNSLNETAFVIEKAEGTGAWVEIGRIERPLGNPNLNPNTMGPEMFIDLAYNPAVDTSYQVRALNVVGDTWDYADPNLNEIVVGGFPTVTTSSQTDPAFIPATVVVPPADPTDLAAAVQAGPQVFLTWTDNAIDETGFVLERSDNGGAFAPIANLSAFAGTGLVSYTDTAVATGNSYSYQVQAVKGALASNFSNTASVTIAPPPAAPSLLTAVFNGTITTGPRVRLQYRDNAVNETGFVVERSDNGGAFVAIMNRPPRAGTGNVPAFYDTTVQGGNTYAYRVYAVNGSTPSGFSNTASVTLLPAPVEPATFTATQTLTNGNTRVRITLSWTDSSNNESRFVIQRASDPNFTTGLVVNNVAANATTFNVSNLPRGTTYYFRIRAENIYGQSAWMELTPFPIVTP